MAGASDYTYVLYHYTPSLPAAAIFCALFAIGTIAHLYFVFRLHARYFIPFVIGCIFECVGYAGRAWSHSNPTLLSPYIMQSLLILVAPAFLAASIYMVLGRIIRLLESSHHSVIAPKWLTKIFVIGDVLSFLVQGSGAGLMAKGDLDSFNLGSNIVIAGLVIQIVIFGFFIVVALVFNVRLVKAPTLAASDPALAGWQKHMFVLYGTSAIILIRNLIRVVEYAQGNNGYIVTHEWMLYIFDALFIFLVVLAFGVVHPNQLLGAKRFGTVASNDREALSMQDVEQTIQGEHYYHAKE